MSQASDWSGSDPKPQPGPAAGGVVSSAVGTSAWRRADHQASPTVPIVRIPAPASTGRGLPPRARLVERVHDPAWRPQAETSHAQAEDDDSIWRRDRRRGADGQSGARVHAPRPDRICGRCEQIASCSDPLPHPDVVISGRQYGVRRADIRVGQLRRSEALRDLRRQPARFHEAILPCGRPHSPVAYPVSNSAATLSAAIARVHGAVPR